MGCTASTLNTPKNCLNISQIFESHDFKNKKKLDCVSLQEEKSNFCGSPISTNNNKEQDDGSNNRDNKATSSLNLQQTSSDANGKEKNFSDDEGQGGDADSEMVRSILQNL